MAYGLKYVSNFYNRHKTLVSVKLYKKDYVGDSVDIRTQEVSLGWNYQDENTPVAGTGVKIVIVNDKNDFDYFSDILTAYEKDFKCVVEYGGEVVFEGYNTLELNELRIVQYNTISLTFVNYLRRLENYYLPDLTSPSSMSRVLDLVEDALNEIGFEYPLYVNSSIFERHMDESDSLHAYCWLWHTWIMNYSLYSGQDEYDDAYTFLNKILKPFNTFIYSYGQRWVIERYSDIDKVGDWIEYLPYSSTPLVGAFTSSLKKEINKQDGDFMYIDVSQILNFQPGLQEIKLNLNEQAFDTQVFNDFDADTIVTTSSEFPIGIPLRTWYINENCTGFEDGVGWSDIKKYFHWHGGTSSTWQYRGMYYRFEIQFNAAGKPTDLSIDYSIGLDGYLASRKYTIARFYVMVASGIGAYKFLYEDDADEGKLKLSTSVKIFEVEFDENNTSIVLAISKVLRLADIYSDLGSPTTQDFIIGILPDYYQNTLGTWYYEMYNYVGDFEVRVSPDTINNEITTTLNKNFLSKEEYDFDFFDLDNVNYVNGLITYDGINLIRTSEWYVEGEDSSGAYALLMDIFVKDKFRKYSTPLHTLRATISCNMYLKPFTIITDDNLKVNSNIIKFVLLGYEWDLVNGTYDIEAEEYPDTDIIISET